MQILFLFFSLSSPVAQQTSLSIWRHLIHLCMGIWTRSYSLCWNLPIHLRDVATLEEKHSALFAEFQKSHFMDQKSKRVFSKIPHDQIREQLIDWLKNHAGVIGNLDNTATVCTEQVAHPEMAHLV